MGDHHVNKFEDASERQAFTKCLLNDLKALDVLIHKEHFEDDIQRIGAEQEMGLVGKDWYPAMVYDKILNEVDDPHFTTELGRFNIEVNLDPVEFSGSCLAQLQEQLNELVAKAKEAAEKHNAHIILTGILPTISSSHLQFKNMTPNPRYKALNEMIRGTKNKGFELNIQGIDELKTYHPNILFEAANTSFQVHYQLTPEKFVSSYNWAQAIAGPVLAVSANSPLLMGRRLWKETRIALFQQSIDMRNTTHLKRDLEPRVTFGKHWLQKSVVELYRDTITRFNPLIAPKVTEDSLEILNQNKIPKLSALCLHSGTVYMWNRVCYGISSTGKPHLRIENRYIPSGPTTMDEIANAAFWLGLMEGMPEEYSDIKSKMEFEDSRYNFYNAARTGLESNFRWMGKSIPAKAFVLNNCLKWARNGLKKRKVNESDIELYLGIIENRVKKRNNGASWILSNFNVMLENSTPYEANINIIRSMHKQESTGKPIHEWPMLDRTPVNRHKHFHTVEQIMNTDIPTVKEDDILQLVINFMVWRNVRYIAVENTKHELVGLVASRILIKLLSEGWKEDLVVKDIMVKEILTVNPSTTTADAIKIMSTKNIGCLPVTSNKKLVGMLTEREIVQATNTTEKFYD
ncbi:MAG: CBS domain-containing protein [Cyclobacteriaceae bacterium]|nr:CBS domain-containing protein [Cyclobacteriaceae bacterium]